MYGQEITQPVPATPGEYMNVTEGFPIYDSVVVSPVMYGNEANVPGWFTTFVAFAAQETHFFFNSRNEAQAHLAYTNKQTIDTMDFVFEAYSFGVEFFSPGVRVLAADLFDPVEAQALNTQIAHWWETELPRHCSIELKIQQDTVLELPAMAANPGYGPSGGGASFDHPNVYRVAPQGVSNADYHPVLNMAVTQGEPYLKNRFPLPDVLKIPRTGHVEAILTVSPIARAVLTGLNALNPYYLLAGLDAGPPYTPFPARFGIRCSLLGKRSVQRRAQWHR